MSKNLQDVVHEITKTLPNLMLWYHVFNDPQAHPRSYRILELPHGKWDFKKSH